CPHHFDRLPDGLRGFDSIRYEVRFTAPAESATAVGPVDIDCLCWKTRSSNRRLVCGGLTLRRNPNVTTVTTHVCRAIHRLHASMRKKRKFEDAFERSGGVVLDCRC